MREAPPNLASIVFSEMLSRALRDAEPSTREAAPSPPAGLKRTPTFAHKPEVSVPLQHDLSQQHPPISAAERLRALADAAETGAIEFDVYGQGAALQAFEQQVAQLLGKEAGCFFATGTGAQHAALLALTPDVDRPTVLLHPTSHLVHLDCLRDGPMQDAQFENTAASNLALVTARKCGDVARVLSFDDVRRALAPDVKAAAATRPDVLVVELPMRMLGGATPSLDDLQKLSALCRASGVKLHLDGARLWEALPAYPALGSDISALAALFDSVYVSFYKGIGAMGCAMLTGDAKTIEAARRWQKRRGGDLFCRGPLALDCQLRLNGLLSPMPPPSRGGTGGNLALVQAACAAAATAAAPGITPERAALAGVFGARCERLRRYVQLASAEAAAALPEGRGDRPVVLFSPRVPQCGMVHGYVRGPPAARGTCAGLQACHDAAMAKSGVRLWGKLRGPGHASLPGEPAFDNPPEFLREHEWHYFEWSIGAANSDLPDEAVRAGWRAFLEEHAAWMERFAEDVKDTYLVDSCVVS